jgi:hypothetical protein
VALALWRRAPSSLVGWTPGASLESLHGGSTTGGAGVAVGRVGVLDRWGTERAYPAVVSTVQSWLLSAGSDTDESLFSHEVWMALERSHYPAGRLPRSRRTRRAAARRHLGGGSRSLGPVVGADLGLDARRGAHEATHRLPRGTALTSTLRHVPTSAQRGGGRHVHPVHDE